MSASSNNAYVFKYHKNNTYVIRYDQDVLKFFYFGCWNKEECKSGSPFSKVLQGIEDSKINYNFGIISGDNIYADKSINEKGDKIKVFNKDKFTKGVNCFQSLQFPIYSNLGNHDIEMCEVYDLQIQNYPYWFLQNYYSLVLILKEFKVLVLFIDSNLFEEQTELEESCYKNIDYRKIKNEMLSWIELQLKNYQDCKHVIVVGHEPLFGYKDKKGGVFTDYTKFADLFNIFLDINRDIFFLSAHLHNFQHVEIKRESESKYKITEIIAGTGGAEADLIEERLKTAVNSAYTSKTFHARLVNKSDAYGYVSFEIDKNKISFNYKQVYKD